MAVQARSAPARPPQSRPARSGRLLTALMALLWLLVTTLPFVFLVFTTFKSQSDIYSTPVWALPKTLDLSNYILVLQGSFFTYLKNSAFVVIVSIALTVTLSSMATFAFARLKFRFSQEFPGIGGMAF